MGRHIQIIELNGVSSEVAHIYHPYGSLIQAYKDIFTHIRIVYKIALANQHKVRLNAVQKYIFFKELWQLIVSG